MDLSSSRITFVHHKENIARAEGGQRSLCMYKTGKQGTHYFLWRKVYTNVNSTSGGPLSTLYHLV